jgi:hypothetical protein
MTNIINGSPVAVASPVVGLGGHVVGAGPACPPSKRKGPSTKSGVLQNALDKEAARKAEIGKAVKPTIANARTHKEANQAFMAAVLQDGVELLAKSKDGELSKEFREGDDDLPGGASYQMEPGETVGEFTSRLIGEPTPLTNIHSKEDVAAHEVEPVTADELAAALAIIARATKQQAEAIRKAAVERKKVAPEGEKVKKVKELTQAQKDKLAKAEAASATYSVVCMAAMSFVGKGLGESKKMQTALTVISLPALRWLAKRYELKIPSDKKSALLIREFLRVELLTFKPKA